MVDYYGAAELSFVAMRAAGRLDAFPGVEIELRDDVIWARSPWLCDGYAPGQSGPLRRDADGWATVGDRGRFEPDTGLVVLGRGADTVTTAGTTVRCADVSGASRSSARWISPMLPRASGPTRRKRSAMTVGSMMIKSFLALQLRPPVPLT